MRIRVLEDSDGASEVQFQLHSLAHTVANDVQPPASPAPNPAESYLLSLAAGSRRAMNQAINVVAAIIEPGSTAAALDWAKVGYGEVARVRASLAGRYSPNMGNKCLAALRGVMKATFRLGLIDSDSLARAIDIKRIRGERTAKGRAIDAPEISRLIAASDPTTALGVRNAAIVAIGFGCGLRRAELVGLNVGHVLERGEALRILGKGNKERIVYLPDAAQAYLATWLERRGYQEGPLFCAISRAGVVPRRLTEQTIYDVLQSLAAKARIAHISPHDLRRTFVSALLDKGVPLSTVSAMAGHSSISTTAGYDVRGERVKRAASKLLDVAMPTSCYRRTELRSAVAIRS